MQTSIYWNIFSNSIPIIISCIYQGVIQNINIHYATNKEMMTGIGLATILVHCSGGALILGFNMGFTTLAGRAFGAGNKYRFKQVFRQGLTNLGIMLVLFILIAFSTYRIIKLTGQSEAIANYSYQTMIYHLPAFCFYYISDFLWCFLNAQNVFKPVIKVLEAGLVFHYCFSYFISSVYGFYGIVFSTNLSFFIVFLITLLIAKQNGLWKLSWEMLETEQPYQEYFSFVKQCTYIAVPYFLNLFVYEFMTFYLGSYQFDNQTAANVAITNLECIIVSPHLGYSIYAMTKISHYVGENKPDLIKIIIKSTLIISLCTIYFIMALVIILRHYLSNYYFIDEGPSPYFFLILNYFIFRMFLSSAKTNTSFILRGLGLGSQLIKASLFCYYIVGLGSMVLMCKMMETKILGVWIGYSIADITMILIFVYYAQRVSLKDITSKLREKLVVGEQKEMDIVIYQ